jgi:hypothetical protein
MLAWSQLDQEAFIRHITAVKDPQDFHGSPGWARDSIAEDT